MRRARSFPTLTFAATCPLTCCDSHVGDAAVAAAEHQDLDELVEHQSVGDAGPVAAQRMVNLTVGQQRRDLDPQRFQDGRWQGRHETSR
jgi:hypothetical protein